MSDKKFSQFLTWRNLRPALLRQLRFLSFYFFTFLVVGGFLALNHHFLLPDVIDSHGMFLVALGWWAQSWACLTLAELIWPILILIFFRSQKERNPKRIIAIGERFRKYNLTTPQIWILSEEVPFFTNRIVGWSALPSPFGATLVIRSGVIDQWSSDAYLAWISRMACEQKFFRWSAWSHVLITSLPALLILALGWASPKLPFAGLATAMALGVFVASYFQEKYRQRLIDLKTMKDFHFDFQTYQTWQKEWQALYRTPTLHELHIKNLDRRQLPKFIDSLNLIVAGGALAGLIFVALTGPYVPTLHKTNPEMAVTKPVVPPALVLGNLSPLSQAVLSGDMRLFLRALTSRALLHFQDPALNGATPLLVAIQKSDLEFVYFLLSLGSDVRTELDFNAEGALFYAVKSERPLVATKYVLQLPVDVFQKNKEGLTALDVAKKMGRSEVFGLLQARLDHDRNPASQTPAEKKQVSKRKDQKGAQKREKIHLRF